MDREEISDLEEGEMIDNDSDSPPICTKDEFTDKTSLLRSEAFTDYQNGLSDGSVFEVERYLNVKLRQKLQLNEQSQFGRTVNLGNSCGPNIVLSDRKRVEKERFKNTCHYRKSKSYKGYNNRSMPHRTAEDIMYEIDEMVCRNTHCDCQRCKFKDIKYYFKKIYEKKRCKCELRPEEIISNHRSVSKRKKHRRKKKYYNSTLDYDSSKSSSLGRRKRKFKESDGYYSSDSLTLSYNEDNNKYIFHKNVRDFDEVRKEFLEKLKKSETKLELVEKNNETGEDVETFENAIAERDLVPNKIDSEGKTDTLFEGKLSNSRKIKCSNETEAVPLDSESEEEMDLVQLRLIALASNKKTKEVGSLDPKNPIDTIELRNSEDLKSGNNCLTKCNEDKDIDKNELLLRAEALKTALLTKHKKRVNKSALNKVVHKKNSSDDIVAMLEEDYAMAERENENVKKPLEEKVAETSTLNSVSKNENSLEVSMPASSSDNVLEVSVGSLIKKNSINDLNEVEKNSDTVKEENNQINHSFEEDCHILRKKLLCDLGKKKLSGKKSLKNAVGSSKVCENNLSVKILKNKKLFITNQKKVISHQPEKPKPLLKIPQPDIQRVIVHLGSEDSSDDSDEMDLPKENNQVSGLSNGPTSDKRVPIINPMQTKTQTDENALASYERSVEILLSQARKKIEGEILSKRNNKATPSEAVYKHLPLPQRLEYIRLKRKIAEREKLIKAKSKNINIASSEGSNVKQKSGKANEPNTEPTIDTAAPDSSKCNGGETKISGFSNNLAKNSNDVLSNNVASDTKRQQGVCDIRGNHFVKVTKPVLDGKVQCTSSMPAHLKQSLNKGSSVQSYPNQSLLSKLKLLLKKIKIEKTVEENTEKEISKLKKQLNLLEKKKIEQRIKIKKLVEESEKAYVTIKSSTNFSGKEKLENNKEDCVKISQEKEPKLEETAPLKNSNDLEVKNSAVGATAKDSDLNINPVEEKLITREPIEEKSKVECEEMTGACVAGDLPLYNSPLLVFYQGSNISERLDPNVMMCQFDLTGICKDEECSFQHFRKI